MLTEGNAHHDQAPTSAPKQCTRRGLTTGVLVAIMATAARSIARAEEPPQPLSVAEVPTTGARRSGPIEPVGSQHTAAVAPDRESQPVAPVAIQIEAAGIDSPVERVAIKRIFPAGKIRYRVLNL